MSKERILEKIEVNKGFHHNFYYTGYVSEHEEKSIKIETIRGEELIFRHDQIIQRCVLKGEHLEKALKEIKEQGDENEN